MSTKNIRKTEVDKGDSIDHIVETLTLGLISSPSKPAIEIEESTGNTKVIEFDTNSERNDAFTKMQK
jgi:hypothetical protein